MPEMYPLLLFLTRLNAKSVKLEKPEDNRFEWEEGGWNYLQWFKKIVGLPMAETENDLNYYKRARLIEMCKEIERALFFGNRTEPEQHMHSTMGGVEFFVPSFEMKELRNIADFHEMMNRYVFGERAKHHCGQPWVFVPSDIYKMLKEVGTPVTTESVYGIPTIKFYCLRGVAYIVQEKLITDKRIFAVNIDNLVYRYREGRDITVDDNGSRGAVISACVGLELHQPEQHVVVKINE
jgi:hypothetical protein